MSKFTMPDEIEMLAHAMQAGVAMKMHHEPSETEPKHMRVSVNMAQIECGALLALLLAKGIITEDEYLVELKKILILEVETYECDLSLLIGADIKLV